MSVIKYAPIDQQAAAAVKFYLFYDINKISDPNGLRRLQAQAGIKSFGPMIDFPIQFAPKITADNKSANYPEYSTDRENDQKVYYSSPRRYGGSSDRVLNFDLQYLADGGLWNYRAISAIAHFSKSLMYHNFIGVLQNEGIQFPILVIKRLYGAVEANSSTWSVEGVDIKHGDKIIHHGNGLFGPIKTDISFRCKEWTASVDDVIKMGNANTFIKNLDKRTTADWY